MVKHWSGALAPPEPSLWTTGRRTVARILQWAAHGLQLWARRWQPAEAEDTGTAPVLEFHAEAGAPEGALFVNGQRVGVLQGVTRL